MSQQLQARETVYTTNSTGIPAGYTTSTYQQNGATVPAGYTTSTYQQGGSASNVQGTQYYTTNQTYQPATTQQVYQQGVSQVVQGQPITTYEYSGVPQYAASQSHAIVSGQAHGQRSANSEIPVESRIEYIPFEKKYVEYEQVEKIYSVPYEVEVIEYEEVVRSERIPIEKTVTDYYAVETQVEYIRREIEETVMVEQPVERTYERIQYIPVETQIVHYPEHDNYVPAAVTKRTEYIGVQGNVQQAGGATAVSAYPAGYAQQGSRVGATTTTTNYVSSSPTATYAYPVANGGTYTTSTVGNGVQGYTTGNTGAYTTGTTYVSGGNAGTYTTGGNGGSYVSSSSIGACIST